MAVIIFCISFFGGQIDSKFFASTYDKILINVYAETSLSLYDKNNTKPIKKWLDYIKNTKHINLFILNTNGAILSSSPIPEHLKSISNKLKAHTLTQQVYKDHLILMSAPIIQGKNDTYRLAMYLSERPTNSSFNSVQNITLRLCLTLIISFGFCYAVSLLFSKRLNQIEQSVTLLSKGELDTRTPISISKGHDEVSSLANQINLMANKIQALISSKERLLEDISHELRSPLARQQIALEIARRKTSTIDKHHLDRIEQENIHMEHLVNELLTLAKLNHAKRPLHPEAFNMNTLIEKIIQNAHYEAQTECITFHACKHSKIIADKHLIYRAIENIIRNALRYTNKNKKIEITLQHTPSDFILTVSDNGPGIHKKDLDHIFSPFYKAQTSYQQQKLSYGLGLSITKQIIDLHEGTISATNKPSGGLEISIHLPHKPK